MEKRTAYRPWLYWLAILLLFPALLINLGVLTLIDDEAIRALVALEMKLSGNWVTPTLHGEFYYNKPPLYNWILLVFFSLTGVVNEFTARLPTVLALVGFGATIFYFFRRHYSRKVAFLNAFVFITCGRVLFWDSMLALIDTCFSWVMFTLFMVVYHEMEKRRYTRLFLLAYLLAAVGFLLKGLPSIVFLGITLLTWFLHERSFRRLLSWPHVLGGLLFLLIVGGYYGLYHQYNSLENVFATLFRESSKRTAVHYGLGRTVLHFFTFPFELIYHFLPWTLMVVFFLRRGSWRLILEDRFIVFNLLIFFANILIYWISPEVYPRYLLMLMPLLFSSFIYLWDKRPDTRFWGYRFFTGFLGGFCILLTLGSLAPTFLERIPGGADKYLLSILLFLSLGSLTWAYFTWKSERLILFVLAMLVFRVGFNWFVLPDRNRDDYGDLCRNTSLEAGKVYPERDLCVYWAPGVEPISSFYLQPTNSFYLTRSRGEIIPLRMSEDRTESDLLIIDPVLFPGVSYEKVGEIRSRHQGRKIYHLGR